jgi:hypothetical protein
MDEDFLEEGVRAFAHADSRVVLVSARRRVIRPDGRRTRLTRGLVRRTRSVAGSTAIRRCIRSASNLIGESSFVLVRRGDLVDALPFRMSYVVDLEMWTRILHDRDCIAIARALGSFRLSATSGTTAQRHSQARQVRDFIHHVHRTTPGLLRPTDRCAGIVRAQINQLLRRIVIRILTR